MSIEYEMPNNDDFVMEVKFIDCILDPGLKDKIFDHMKNENMLLEYLKDVLPNVKIRKIIKNAPSE